MNILSEKFREVLQSVIPIYVIVLLVYLFVIDIPFSILLSFTIGTLVVLIGLTIFLTGVDIGIGPIGEHMGKGIARSNKLWMVIVIGFAIGFLIAASEPSVIVLGDQLEMVSDGLINGFEIVMWVSVGLAIMIVIGLMRIIYQWKLTTILTIAYLSIFAMSLFSTSEFVAIAFDASGATTGAITVPFILTMAAGIASLKKDTDSSSEDSFGLVAIASSGAIISVLLLNFVKPVDELTGSLDLVIASDIDIVNQYLTVLSDQAIEVFFTLAPIVILFWLFQKWQLNLSKTELNRIYKGVVYVYIGLVLFMTGVNAGFMDMGSIVGYTLGSESMYIELSIIGLIFGVVTIIAEPAVNVLTHQIESVTSGAIHRTPVLVSLCIGVGLAILLAILRMIIPGLELWHMLLPGYIIALGLQFIVPNVFVGMAFDAGGVATGPLTATFILAFVQGAAEAIPTATVIQEGFGMIALVALMPILTLQILGFIYKMKQKTNRA